jgi:membrane protein
MSSPLATSSEHSSAAPDTTDSGLVAPKMRGVPPWPLLRAAMGHWVVDRCSANAAAIAFYAVFSISSLLLVAFSAGSLLIEPRQIERQLALQLSAVMGAEATQFVLTSVLVAQRSLAEAKIAWLSLFVTLVGATAMFDEIQSALNVIMGVKAAKGFLGAAWADIQTRLRGLILVFGLGVLLVISILVDVGIGLAMQVRDWGVWTGVLAIVGSQLVTLGILGIVFTALLAYLPDRRPPLGAAATGAGVAAVLFMTGKGLFSLYVGTLGHSGVFVAAGALAVVLMWLFFSAAVLLFGAQVARCLRDIAKTEASAALALTMPASQPLRGFASTKTS